MEKNRTARVIAVGDAAFGCFTLAKAACLTPASEEFRLGVATLGFGLSGLHFQFAQQTE